jgi:hypothetical protein
VRNLCGVPGQKLAHRNDPGDGDGKRIGHKADGAVNAAKRRQMEKSGFVGGLKW